jgi:hypothetical protein
VATLRASTRDWKPRSLISKPGLTSLSWTDAIHGPERCEREFRHVALQRGTRRVHLHVPRVGALKVACGAALRGEEGIGAAAHPAAGHVSAQAVRPVAPRVQEVEPRELRVAVQQRLQRLVVQPPVRGGEQSADHGSARPHVAPDAAHEVVAERLHRRRVLHAVGADEPRLLAVRRGVQDPHRPPVLRAAADLGRAQDARLLRRIDEAEGGPREPPLR